ncbi:MAG: putative glycoside hydrolase [Anaerolineaceae bacterium]|nr:putative glycoside hydrolase [Anaerolineaceae bacterium]
MRWRKILLGFLLAATGLAACQPEPPSPPTPTSLAVTPTVGLEGEATPMIQPQAAVSQFNGIQLAWFYKPPEDGLLEPIAENFDVYIMTKKGEEDRDELKTLGVETPFLQYLLSNSIQDRGNCTTVPFQNNVANQAGDFCRISAEHPDWFLLDAQGNRIQRDNFYIMDSGNPQWLDFWLGRAQETQETLGWDGVFLDNIEASLGKREEDHGMPARYKDDASYQAAVEGSIRYLYTNYFQPQRRPLYANIIAIRDPNVWLRYMQYLDGAMLEDFAVDWWDGYLDPAEWEEQLDMLTRTQQMGKAVILVAQGPRDDLQRQEFAFASYLLVDEGLASFRYAHHSAYSQAWLYDNYNLDLGQALGAYYQEDGVWKRDFEKAVVTVDPAGHEASIAMKP